MADATAIIGCRNCHERIRTAGQELARHRKAHERLAHDEDAVAPKDVVDARELRDSGWSIIRRRFVQGVPVPADEIHVFAGTEADLANTYETACSLLPTLWAIAASKMHRRRRRSP